MNGASEAFNAPDAPFSALGYPTLYAYGRAEMTSPVP